jgi:hypothetical protein
MCQRSTAAIKNKGPDLFTWPEAATRLAFSHDRPERTKAVTTAIPREYGCSTLDALSVKNCWETWLFLRRMKSQS